MELGRSQGSKRPYKKKEMDVGCWERLQYFGSSLWLPSTSSPGGCGGPGVVHYGEARKRCTERTERNVEREILAAQRRRVKEEPDLERQLNTATSSCFFDEITTVMHRCKGSEQAFRLLSFFCRERRRGGEKCACDFISASRTIKKKCDNCVGG